ncbi:adenylyltransferase/cytidyltransferase family protein [Paenibacillus rhizoplanae]
MKTLGLTLGKFAPLHKGHQFMFETALREVDELIVVIYETTVSPVPLQIRANWIRSLYPAVRVIEAWDGPDGYSDDREHEIREEQYILGLLKGEQVTHFYSSEFYGGHMSRALGGPSTGGWMRRGCRCRYRPRWSARTPTNTVIMSAGLCTAI